MGGCIFLFQRVAAITTFGKVLDEFSASLVKESVGRTYRADSEEKAEWRWRSEMEICSDVDI